MMVIIIIIVKIVVVDMPTVIEALSQLSVSSSQMFNVTTNTRHHGKLDEIPGKEFLEYYNNSD